MSVCAVTRVVFWRENASPTAFEKKKQNKKINFEDDKIQSQFLYVTNSRRKSKVTSGGRNKSTGTSSESGSEIILLRSSATKRWIFPLEVKRILGTRIWHPPQILQGWMTSSQHGKGGRAW